MNLIPKLRFLCHSIGNKSCALNSYLPLFLLPIFVYFAIGAFSVSILVFFFVLPAFLCHMLLLFRFGFSKTNFFYVWSIVSALYIFSCFEFLVVPLMIISPSENIIFYALFGTVIVCAQKVKKNAPEVVLKVNCINCRVTSKPFGEDRSYGACCNSCYPVTSRRNVWIDCSIGESNYKHYYLMLVSIFAWLTYTSYLILTTFCQPQLVFNSVLVPTDCSEAYETSRSATCIVGVMYSVEIVTFIIANVLRENISVCKSRNNQHRTIIS